MDLSNPLPALLAITLLILSPATHAQEQRPRVIHGPNLSCVHVYSGGTTSVTCDESARVISAIAQRENDRIDEVKKDEYRDAKDRWDLELKRKAEYEQIDIDADARLLAKFPKGMGCVKRRIGDRPLTTAKPSDLKACERAINQDK